MFDIIFIQSHENTKQLWKNLKARFPLAKKAISISAALKVGLTEFVWIVPDDVIVNDSFNFDYTPDSWSKDYIHLFKNGETYDGIALLPKHIVLSDREISHRFYINKKEIDIKASNPKPYDVFLIDSYNEYVAALENSTTDMFWMSSRNIAHNDKLLNTYYISHHKSQDKSKTHAFVHQVQKENLYNGLFLCSKQNLLSEREVEYRFPVERIEHDIVASTGVEYDIFEIDSYVEYLDALENSTTEMFWMSSANISATIPDIYFVHNNEYDRKQNHTFLHCENKRNGLFLMSKHVPVTQREIEHRFIVNAKEWDVVASGPVEYPVYEIDTYEEYLQALEQSKTELFWMSSANITATIPDIYFTHDNEYDRTQNHNFLHCDDKRNGLFLCSKYSLLTQKEVEYRHLVNSKEWDVVASGPVEYPVYEIDTYEEYLNALNESKTEMFWMSSANITATIPDVYFTHDNEYDRTQNHAFIHRVDGKDYYNGLFLCSKHRPLTQKEIEHRHIVNRKEWDVVASGPVEYPVYEIDTYEQYQIALNESKTEMFWMSSANINAIIPDIYFTHNNEYDRKQNHAFIHRVDGKNHYNGLFLCSKHRVLTEREIEYRHLVNRKEWDVVASGPVEYPVYEIDTYEQYQTALNESKTEMFWASSSNIKAQVPNIYFTHDNEYDRKTNHTFIHKVNNQELRNGLFLLSKHVPLTKRELEHRFIVNAKEWDVVASGPIEYPVYEIDTYEEYLNALNESKTEMFWMSSANITATIPDVYFTHDNEYDRTQNHAFIHKANDRVLYNGLFLCSKHRPLTQKEVEHRHIVNRKEWNIVASGPKTYDIFTIDSYEDYLNAYDNTTTEMFWATSNNIKIDNDFQFDIYFSHDNSYDRLQNHVFAHRVNGTDLYNGLFLLSKHVPLTKREVEHRYIVNRKEWNVVASGPCEYEMFYPKNYEDYLTALKTSKTEMFWIIPDYVDPTNRFKFNTYFSFDQTYEREINHAYLNGKYHDGIVLCSKYAKFSRREFDYKFIAAKKEVNIVISTPKPYDTVFISYEEPNADENYARILERFPNTKRIHGVKGIHQAHIEAAKLSDTDMFWIIDGDATIVDDFKFNYQVARWDKDTVHVWRSQNPINDMVYGYGGVKLFPTELTLNMDTSKPDMTTSISSKFKAVNAISNITAFNTDPFNTWKSAFRECVKLSSKVIDRQQDDETNERLRIWQTVGKNKLYGNYSLLGANQGAEYGYDNKDNLEALKKINNFDWLKERFDANI